MKRQRFIEDALEIQYSKDFKALVFKTLEELLMHPKTQFVFIISLVLASSCNGQPQIKPSTTFAIGTATMVQNPAGNPTPNKTLKTPTVTSQTSQSIFLTSIARGSWGNDQNQGVQDSFSNTYSILGTGHFYADYPASGAGVFYSTTSSGGTNHSFFAPCDTDEVTISAIEIRGASAIESHSWVERTAANTITSAQVHTNGAAILIAWWWGSGGVRPTGDLHKAVPENGFTLIPNASGLVSLSESGYIQVAAAYKIVNAAGDYTINWQTDNEGAQLYLIALH